MQINSVVIVQDIKTQKWEFDDIKENFSFQGFYESDFIQFGCHGRDCIYKSNS